jgi:patatin-related protein
MATPRRELRFALVLYGGVSLCIYMHGTTKEIDRLVSASAALAAGEAAGSASEQVYRELLEWLAERDRVRTDVSVDVVAGTSAGGINGVYLAKAMARNLSQDGLRDVWLERGSLNVLLWGPSFLNWRLRVPGALLRLPCKPALDGVNMARWLHEALAEMDDGGPRSALPTLMPPGASMDLMVTMTDFYGYDRQVAIRSPTIVRDEQHRHVLRFSQAEKANRYGEADNLALAFAARATSCFPGAFEPVSPTSLCEWVSAPGRISDEFFRIYELSRIDPQQRRFVDGGVLDNRPFVPAIDAIRRKPAHSEVERWVLYLDPAPRDADRAAAASRSRGDVPRPLETIVGAIAGLPRKQPIIDSLVEIEDMNMRVREIRDVIEASFPRVRERVEQLAPDALEVADDAAEFDEAERRLAAHARQALDIGYAAYLRTRVAGLMDSLGDATCTLCAYPPDSNHAMLTRRIWLGWAERRRLFSNALDTPDARLELLESVDVNYALRRVHFTLAGVNWLYEPPSDSEHRSTRAARAWPGVQQRQALDHGKSRMWDAIADLEGLLTRALERHADAVRACFPEEGLGDYVVDHGLDAEEWVTLSLGRLDGLVANLREELRPRLGELVPAIYETVHELGERTDLHVRFVGFALFDAYLYPVEYAAGAGERDRVDVMRVSPLDATLLRWSEPKVKGSRYGHFGAFMHRKWRESDYLAGRLDGAERMVSLLVGEDEGQECRRWSGRAFRAILEEERASLHTAGRLIDDLETQSIALHKCS